VFYSLYRILSPTFQSISQDWFDIVAYSFRNLINSRIRSSRSHESLLTNHVNMHAIDLTASDLDIKPLHSSVLGQDHCFQVSTANGSKYITCRTVDQVPERISNNVKPILNFVMKIRWKTQ
jgi:hypothetical protein